MARIKGKYTEDQRNLLKFVKNPPPKRLKQFKEKDCNKLRRPSRQGFYALGSEVTL